MTTITKELIENGVNGTKEVLNVIVNQGNQSCDTVSSTTTINPNSAVNQVITWTHEECASNYEQVMQNMKHAADLMRRVADTPQVGTGQDSILDYLEKAIEQAINNFSALSHTAATHMVLNLPMLGKALIFLGH